MNLTQKQKEFVIATLKALNEGDMGVVWGNHNDKEWEYRKAIIERLEK